MDEDGIFCEALKRLPELRRAYLDEVCGDDGELRARLEARVVAHGLPNAEDRSPADIASTQDRPSQEVQTARLIGNYRLIEQIGEGGMGVVFVAEQERPVRRKVALKVIKPGMDTKEVIARFEAERQALALMDHPNIAHVLDAGSADSGRPFFVMELVRGIPITEYCDQNRLTVRERLALFVSVCQAVQHAHQKGIIHRDLKPSNVLVTLHDGKPVPKVIDFGVAKALNQRLTDRTIYTRFSQIVGTPLYMSPEQAALNALDVDTRSDIYSLGVLLYVLLTGSTPFDKSRFEKAAYEEIRRIVREEEPAKPSTKISTLGETASSVSACRKTDPQKLGQLLRGDLDWIVLKALEKDRTRRYETASGFANDVQRYLNDEPVKARPPSAMYVLRKLVRRHKGAVLAASGGLLALLVGITITTSLMFWALREQERANLEKQTANQIAEKLRRQLYVADLNVARKAWVENDVARVLDILRSHENAKDLQGFEWYHLWHLCQRALEADRISFPDAVALAVTFSPDGNTMAVAHPGNRVTLVDVRKGSASGGFGESYTRNYEAHFIAYSPDGQRIAYGGTRDRPNTVLIRNLKSGQDEVLDAHTGLVRGVAFSPNGKQIATGSADGTVIVWDSETQSPLREFGDRGPAQEYDVAARRDLDSEAVWSVAFSPDGKFIAVGCGNGVIKIWDWKLETARDPLRGHTRPVWAIKFTSDGSRLVSASADATAKIWELESGTDPKTLAGHGDMVRGVAIFPDDTTVATASRDNTVRLWDLTTAEHRETLRGHACLVQDVAISPDGKLLVSASQDYSVMLWDATVSQSDSAKVGDGAEWVGIYGRTVISLSRSGQLEQFELATLERTGSVFSTVDKPTCMDVSENGTLAVGFTTGFVRLKELADLESESTFEAHDKPLAWVELSNDGKTMATTDSDGSIRLWRRADREWTRIRSTSISVPIQADEHSPTALSSDGHILAVAAPDYEVHLLDVETGETKRRLKPHRDVVLALAFSHGGRWLATGSFDNTARIWDLSDRSRKPIILTGHSASVRSLVFSKDDRTLLTAAGDRLVKLWDIGDEETTREKFALGPLDSAVASVAIAPDDSTVVSGTRLGTIRVWRTASETEVVKLQERVQQFLSE